VSAEKPIQQAPIQAQEKPVQSPAEKPIQAPIQQAPIQQAPTVERQKIQFSDVDNAVDIIGNRTNIAAPKTLERLEQLAMEKQKIINYSDDDDEPEKLTIGENISLDIFDINDLEKPMNLRGPPILDDIEILT
jgi:hypothetical protein